jgi:hypothetical protein
MPRPVKQEKEGRKTEPVTGQAVPPAQGAQREQGPPGCRLDMAKGGLARAARCKGPPESQFGRKRQGGAWGPGGAWGAKNISPNLP